MFGSDYRPLDLALHTTILITSNEEVSDIWFINKRC